MNRISTVDQPVQRLKRNDGSSADLLETVSYAQALAEFATNCQTPLTIGVQGEWGSGKTSLLNMMQEAVEEREVKTRGRGSNLRGADIYKCIWINTWEHSLLKSPEECLLSIIDEIIDSIAVIDGSWQTAQKAKSALGALAKGAFRIGATMALGSKGGDVADELVGGSDGNSIKSLRSALDKAVDDLVNREQNYVERFIIFVDDLDRIDPPVAVMVLELLKNIFDIDHCVFVIAIDYQVVVKGLKEKFGEQTDQNEWEFRAFFDKIIQLPFMMPMSNYNVNNYVEGLLQEIAFFRTKDELKIMKSSKLSDVVRLTVGANPRALKRLINSLSLIVMHRKININKSYNSQYKESDEWIIKQLLVALVCFQISFPKIYELLLYSPLFYTWDDTFVNRVTKGVHQESESMEKALNRAIEIHEDEFDEEWEQALFKIVWVMNWQKSRVVEASKTLNLIKDRVLAVVNTEETKEKILGEALRMTAVTSVVSTDETMLSSVGNDDDKDLLLSKVGFWREFQSSMKNTGCCFEGVSVRPTYSSDYIATHNDKMLPYTIKFVTCSTSSRILKIESNIGDVQENYELFEWFKKYRKELEAETGEAPKFKLSKSKATQTIYFSAPNKIALRLNLMEKKNEAEKKKVFSWLADNMPKIEAIITKAIDDYENNSATEESSDLQVAT